MARSYTAELLKARAGGAKIVCSMQPHRGVAALYVPRSKNDSHPWAGLGTEYRFSGRECHAVDLLSTTGPDAGGTPAKGDTVRLHSTGTEWEVGSVWVSPSGMRVRLTGVTESLPASEVTVVRRRTPDSCRVHRVYWSYLASAASFPLSGPCETGTYGVWDENDAGFVFAADCAMTCANWAALELGVGAGLTMRIMRVCDDHAEQPAETCEDCFG